MKKASKAPDYVQREAQRIEALKAQMVDTATRARAADADANRIAASRIAENDRLHEASLATHRELLADQSQAIAALLENQRRLVECLTVMSNHLVGEWGEKDE